MSQPWQPASQPQPPQPDGSNPYAQSPSAPGPGAPPPMPPQTPPGPPGPPAGPPPGMPQQSFPGPPGQPPGQPQFPQQQPPMPGAQQQFAYPGQPVGRQGSAAGAFFLALLVSVVVSLIYSGIFFATYQEMTDVATVNIIYMAHAVINGAAVGAIGGLIGRRNNAAHVAAGIVAVLGAFFGQANAALFVQMDVMGSDIIYLLREKPFFPAEMWWGRDVESGLLSLLGLLLAAAAGWGIARLIGSRR